jgi:hypothetical protein
MTWISSAILPPAVTWLYERFSARYEHPFRVHSQPTGPTSRRLLGRIGQAGDVATWTPYSPLNRLIIFTAFSLTR